MAISCVKGNQKLAKFLAIILLIPPTFSQEKPPTQNKRHFIKLEPIYKQKQSTFTNSDGSSTPVQLAPKQTKLSPTAHQSHSLPHPRQDGTIVIRKIPSMPHITPKTSLFLQQHPQNHFIQPFSPFPPSFAPSLSTSTSLSTKCKGKKNLLDDIGILSLVLAVVSSSVGLYTLIVNSMTSNQLGVVSGFFSLMIWLPATLITLFNWSGDHIQLINNFLNGLGFINSMYGYAGVFFGTVDVLASSIGETLGILSFILSVIATFPELLDRIIEYLYSRGNRPKLQYYMQNYGCSVPGIFTLEGEKLYDTVNNFLLEGFDMKL